MLKKVRKQRTYAPPSPRQRELAKGHGVTVSLGDLVDLQDDALERRTKRLERDVLAAVVDAFKVAECYDRDATFIAGFCIVGARPTPEGLVDLVARNIKRDLVSRREMAEQHRKLECTWTSRMVDHLTRRMVAEVVDGLIRSSKIWLEAGSEWWFIAPSVVDRVHTSNHAKRRPHKVSYRQLAAA